MGGKLASLSSPAIGNLGLMTTVPGTENALDLCRIANNAVIERSGRISARKAINLVTPVSGSISTPIRSVTETIRKDATIEVVWASDSKFQVYNKSTGAVTDLAGAAAVTQGDWQYSNDGNTMICSQVNRTLEGFTRNGSGDWQTAAVTNKASWTDSKYSVSHIAFGRSWVANRADEKSTVYGSVLLTPLDFNSAGSGSIDLTSVWANGQDEIVAITSHANFLILLGKTQVVLYNMPADLGISGMTLAEVIKNVGCVSKYSVCSTGNDLVWLSQEGVVSLGRLIQNGSQLPMGDVSQNVHYDVMSRLASATDPTTIRAVYLRDIQSYVMFFSDATAYVFNLRGYSSQNGTEMGAKATTWSSLDTSVYGGLYTRDGTSYFVGTTGLFLYSGYSSTAYPYTLTWQSGYSDMGDPTLLKFLKALKLKGLGAVNQLVTIQWAWDFQTTYSSQSVTMTGVNTGASEWGIAEYGIGQWSVGSQVTGGHTPGTGSGATLQIGLSAAINSAELTFYSLDIMCTTGKKLGAG